MENMKKIPDCPVEMTLQLIGDKWKVLIIRVFPPDTPSVFCQLRPGLVHSSNRRTHCCGDGCKGFSRV